MKDLGNKLLCLMNVISKLATSTLRGQSSPSHFYFVKDCSLYGAQSASMPSGRLVGSIHATSSSATTLSWPGVAQGLVGYVSAQHLTKRAW